MAAPNPFATPAAAAVAPPSAGGSASAASSRPDRDRASQRVSIKTRTGTDSIQTLKRAQVFADISKARRAENFNKRRRGHEAAAEAEKDAAAAAATAALSAAEVQALLTAFRAAYVTPTGSAPAQHAAATAALIPSPAVPPAERARLLRQLRLLLSNDDAPVAAVVAAGAIPCLIAELSAQVGPGAAAVAAAPASSAFAAADQQGGAASSQLDAIWCLTNIASDTTAHTRAVLPAAPLLISFLSGANIKIQEQCVWCLGNLASEEQECRRQLLDNGILVPLIRLLQLGCPPPSALPPLPLPVPAPTDPAQLALVRVVSWALSNLIKTSRSAAKALAGAGASQDDVQRHLAAFAAAAPSLVPTLFALLRSTDEQLALEATWVVAAWAHHGEAVLNSLVQNGLLPALLARMYLLRLTPVAQGPPATLDPATGLQRDPLAGSLIPLVRVLGNLANGSDAVIQALLSTVLPTPPTPPSAAATAAGPAAAPSPVVIPNAFVLVFSTLERSLSSLHRGLKKETCWVLANLAASGVAEVHNALVLNERGEAGVFVQLLFQTIRQAQFDVKREAGHCLYNLCRCRDGFFLPVLFPRVPLNDPVATNASPSVLLLREFCDFLRSRDADAILIGLRVLDLLLRAHPDGIQLVEREGGIDALEAVQQHCEQAQLVDYAHQLVDKYFGANLDDEEEDEDDAQHAAAAAQQDNEELPPWRVQHQSPNRPPAAAAGAGGGAAPAASAQAHQPGPPPGGFKF